VSGQGPAAAGGSLESAGRVPRRALVLTVSDRSAAGTREDDSGSAVAERLAGLGFAVEREVVPDDQARIEAALREAAPHHAVIVTTGGTGLTPRDVTPQATLAVIDYTVPGMAEAMRADGRRHTPMADLSRAVVGVRERTLIVNLPGSPRGAIESLEAIVAVLDHALETLAGPFDHGSASGDATAGGSAGAAAPRTAPAAAALPAQDLPEPTPPARGDPRVVPEPDEHE
jgi:molybdenum cofactor synthesis domain-containing protein